jgi:hypothetical protein
MVDQINSEPGQGNEETALRYARDNGNTEIVTVLVELGMGDATALRCAREKGYTETVKLLEAAAKSPARPAAAAAKEEAPAP